jgi:hypothetical protein
LPLSSTARVRTVTGPLPATVHVYVHCERPVAGCQVVPPSVETSTPPTTPPPVSVAVPATVTTLPCARVVLFNGVVTVDVGAVVSVDAVAGASVSSGVPGCTPMSANTLTVACCAFGSAASPVWFPIRVNDQLIVPASNTRAPLGARYSVR